MATRPARFIWTDKLALAAAVSLLAFVALIWLFAYLAIGSAGAKHILYKEGAQGIEFALLAAALFWIVLQGVDFAARGLYKLWVQLSGKGKARVWIYDGHSSMREPSMRMAPARNFRARAPLAPHANAAEYHLWHPAIVSRDTIDIFDRTTS